MECSIYLIFIIYEMNTEKQNHKTDICFQELTPWEVYSMGKFKKWGGGGIHPLKIKHQKESSSSF